MIVNRSNLPGDMNLSDTVRYWLSSWDFVDNPFALWEAGREPWLERYFIRPPFYEQLLTNPKSTLIFAPRGGGKTATRIMLEAECRPMLSAAPVFAVPFTDFSPIAESTARPLQVTLADYFPHLTAAALPRLMVALAADLETTEQLTSNDLGELRYWIDHYAPYILKPRYLRTLLQLFDSKLNEENLTILVSSIQRDHFSLKDLNARLAVVVRWLLALRSATPILPDVPIDSPSRAMEIFVRLVLQLLNRGSALCHTFYLLVDGIDEYVLTQDSPATSAEILRSLLGNLHFLELPGFAVKFFLPAEHRTELERVARTDRLDIVTLTWEQAKEENQPDYLRELLRRRIAAFNTRGLHTLGELCDPSLRRWLEDAMLEEARDSPRNLMRLGNLLFAEHCREMPIPESVLLPIDWEYAVARFRASIRDQNRVQATLGSPTSMPLFVSSSNASRLHIDFNAGKVYRGVEELPPLSDLEYRLLSFLYRHRGQICTKDEIVLAVYEPKYGELTHSSRKMEKQDKKLKEAEEAAIARLFNRLRVRIEPEPSKPVYIITIRGRGYRLDNAE